MTGPLYALLPPADHTDADSDELLGRFLDYVSGKGLELYPAQEEAILALFEGKNVILNTPTGSGKTLAASALHFASLAHNRRSVYTCPIKALVNEKFLSLCRDFGLALILVTHDLPVVAQLCDYGAVMYAGEIVELGLVDTLYHAPRHPYTRLLFAATPDLGQEKEEIVSIAGAPPRLDQPLVGCPFRPRCDRAFAPCASSRPLLRSVSDRHSAACHLNDLPAGATR